MLKLINKVLFHSIWLMALYLFIFTNYYYILVILILLGLVIYKLIKRYDKKNKINLPSWIYLGFLIMIYLNIVGEFIFEFYYGGFHYDKFLHFIVPVYLISLVYYLTKRNLKKSILIVLSVCIGWELLEYLVDLTLATPIMQEAMIKYEHGVFKMWGSFKDTLWDTIYNLCGMMVGYFIFKRGEVKWA